MIAPPSIGRSEAPRFRHRAQGWKSRGITMLVAVFVWLASPFHSFAWSTEFKLFDPLAETKIEPIETFVAAEAFRVGDRIGGITLGAVGLNFVQHFLGVVEKHAPATSLRSLALAYTTGDKSLVRELGGDEEAAVPFLAFIHHVMAMGLGGPSHTDGRSNFAYVRSPIDQRLWAVHWTVNYANEWTIGAVYVPHPDLDWRSGSRLFTNGRVPHKVIVRGSHVQTEP